MGLDIYAPMDSDRPRNADLLHLNFQKMTSSWQWRNEDCNKTYVSVGWVASHLEHSGHLGDLAGDQSSSKMKISYGNDVWSCWCSENFTTN